VAWTQAGRVGLRGSARGAAVARLLGEPKSGATMIQVTGIIASTTTIAAAQRAAAAAASRIGQKSCTMIRRPFTAWKSTAKKISSSAKRKSGLL
jgi:hypothetical protein